MKLLIVVLCLMSASLCQPAFAETSVALKTGYIFYAENGKSPYEGNTIMDNELTEGGVYIRKIKDNWIYRLDIDNLKTGNTFQKQINAPYEKVDFNFMPVTLSIGKYIYKNFYCLAGAGYSFNKMIIEKYATDPFTDSIGNSFVYTVTIGYDININKWLYLFIEGRFLRGNAKIYINETLDHKEDIGNIGTYAGIGIKF